MSGLLADIFVAGDRAKKRVKGLLDPQTYQNAMDYSTFEPLTQQQLIDGLLGAGVIKVLHGTPTPFKDFDFSYFDRSTKADHSGLGAFFMKADDPLSKQTANFYAGTGSGANVRMHGLDAKKTYTMSPDDPLWKEATNSRAGAISVRQRLLQDGYDSIYTPQDEVVALSPDIIKSWWR